MLGDDLGPRWLIPILAMGLCLLLLSPCHAVDKRIGVDQGPPVVDGYFMPSGIFDGAYEYREYYKSWINYCPNCGHYNCLGVFKPCHEGQISCYICDSDYSGCSGWEKIYYKRGHLLAA